MAEETLLNLLSNVAAPVLICLYTLFGVNKTLNKQDETLKNQNATFRDLTTAINKLSTDIDKRLDRLEDKNRQLSFQIENLQRRSDSHDLQRH